ncbi:zinc finger protein 39 isoform X1 [Spodoptera frugiperda]|uniref:Zinc finger protein 39 isoform X1 n=1 Tax=Spodoptera frugiperda TaxID=7108 RepID=A0A9R0EGS4_SPOFR|nr:zinc finger protein 39 isoform X1 [Spodoptera frugiperda]
MAEVSEGALSSEPLLLLPGNPLQYPIIWGETTAHFTCRLCMKTFYNKNALQNHKKTQHDDEVINSDVEFQQKTAQFSDHNMNGLCGFNFIPLNKHNDEQITGRDGFITRTFSEDTTYLIIKIERNDIDTDAMKRFRLDGVVKKTQMKSKLPVDLRGPFTCTFPSTLRPDLLCRQIFFNCCDYSLHYREEHTKRRKAALRCQVCEKRLDRKFYSNETIPAQLHASTQIPFSCRMCSLIFGDSTEYEEHNRVVHAKTKPHQCSICAKRFTQQGGLQQHMRMHTGVRPFACTFCPKAFTQKAGLDQHLRTHTKVKPFKCVICTKCFSQSVHLRQHMRTHTNIQPFECSVCGRRFKQSSHLNFHMRSHVGDGSLVMDNFVQGEGHDNQMQFLNFPNLQPVQDGDMLYYATELAVAPTANQMSFSYQPQVVIPGNVLSF